MTQEDQTPQADPIALQNELEQAKARITELTNISQQALADLQNFKKRTEEEKSKFVSFANAALISDLIPMLDNLDRALAHLPEDPAARNWAEGLLAITNQLHSLLTARGLETISANSGNFDPNMHEAVMTENGPADQILRELEKGYKLSDRVLRRSKVVVGNGQIPATSSPEAPIENS